MLLSAKTEPPRRLEVSQEVGHQVIIIIIMIFIIIMIMIIIIIKMTMMIIIIIIVLIIITSSLKVYFGLLSWRQGSFLVKKLVYGSPT